ncbi:malate synthase G [Bacillus sp. JCM 19046]|nr:malate synthase G [Bacillus sp. JCM 19046]
MREYKRIGKLHVAKVLHQFIEQEVMPGLDLEYEIFWNKFEQLIHELSPENKVLINERAVFQQQLNKWHQENRSYKQGDYKAFLEQIGYLEGRPDKVTIQTEKIDLEIAQQSGPQLVVPINNARFAVNAANARWGSLYDALYGSDAIPVTRTLQEGYDHKRGEAVITYAKAFLDKTLPLQHSSHKNVVSYRIVENKLIVELAEGGFDSLQEEALFIGFQGEMSNPSSLLFRHHGNGIELQFDRNHVVGASDSAGIKDIVLEAALTTIMDCEDSVTAVDAEDKVAVYRNWLGLMKGDLQATFQKGNKQLSRSLKQDRVFQTAEGGKTVLKGRSLMLIRNVGHLMGSDAILDEQGNDVPEGILDGVVTALIAKHDLLGHSPHKNSLQQSIYIVKPKMHGSKEVAFANTLFNRIEDVIDVPRYTIKIGVMDEERRTSLNLQACINEVKERIFFINTGFLDRTGDEIHTSMEAGAVVRKDAMKKTAWINAYEKANVQAGLKTGFQGTAQIGKGMWAMPDEMAALLRMKSEQLKAGASTAWVPSPTAATLHALHYHEVDVRQEQKRLLTEGQDYLDQLLQVPLARETYSFDQIEEELNNNAQSILGYVVRWIDQGIGCSKVPDMHNTALMEDRATLRISSQLLANWLHHKVCTKEQLEQSFSRMAKVVDEQNGDDPLYFPLSSKHSIAYQAALELVFEGVNQPNGYTEPILHKRRLEAKERFKSSTI